MASVFFEAASERGWVLVFGKLRVLGRVEVVWAGSMSNAGKVVWGFNLTQGSFEAKLIQFDGCSPYQCYPG